MAAFIGRLPEDGRYDGSWWGLNWRRVVWCFSLLVRADGDLSDSRLDCDYRRFLFS